MCGFIENPSKFRCPIHFKGDRGTRKGRSATRCQAGRHDSWLELFMRKSVREIAAMTFKHKSIRPSRSGSLVEVIRSASRDMAMVL
jgi:hypothetical protein